MEVTATDEFKMGQMLRLHNSFSLQCSFAGIAWLT
jgi:hypothetical protein